MIRLRRFFAGIGMFYRVMQDFSLTDDRRELRMFFRYAEILKVQQNTNRNNAELMENISRRVQLMEAEVVRMREAAEFFGSAAEVLARKVK